MGYQSIYIRLPDVLARRINLLLDEPDSGYSSVDEFAEVAIRNQLNVEHAPGSVVRVGTGAASHTSFAGKSKDQPSREAPIGVAVELTRPLEQFQQSGPVSTLPLVAPADITGQRLSPLTNRLSQVKVAARVCANLSKQGSWPDLKEFHSKAAATARAVGIVLRGFMDTRSEGDSATRAHIGYPVGGDPEKAQARFINSFTITLVGERVTGPLAILGLANVVDGKVALTEAGWRFAALPSPLAGESTEGVLLGPEEAAELRARLLHAPAELTVIREFLHDVRRADGSQSKVDQMLNRQYPEWNQGVVIAQRAAMVGRLSDINVLEVDGRGVNALIRLLPAVQDFLTASTEMTNA